MKKFVAALTIFTLLVIALQAFSQSSVKTLVLRPGPADGIDADIRTDMPVTPQGTSPDFIANAWTAQGNYFTQRSLLKFDLSQVPAGASVLQATLYLYTNLTTGHHQLDSGANAANLYRIAEPWSPNQVTWNNQPSFTAADPVFLPQSVTHTQDYTVDVTAHVQDMVANPATNFGWLFKLQTEEKYRCMVFASSNNLNEEWRPKIVIQYTSCELPVAGFSFVINSREVQFTDISTHAASWNWTFGDGSTSTDQNPVHTYANQGNFQVCLEVADSCGFSTHCEAVVIDCAGPQAGFTFSNAFTTVSFTDTSHVANPLSWFWEFGDSTTSTLQNPVHQYSNYGFYKVYLTVTNGCGTDQAYQQVVLSEPPLVPGFSTSQNETDNLEVSFSNQSTGATWWHWDFGDGTSSAGQNPIHVYEKYGEYQVCLTAGNQASQETACNPLKVAKIDVGQNGYSILFYPNPYSVSGKLYFMLFEDAGVVNITVTDLSGRTILKREYTDARKEIPVEVDINGLERGTYLVKGTFNTMIKITKLEVR